MIRLVFTFVKVMVYVILVRYQPKSHPPYEAVASTVTVAMTSPFISVIPVETGPEDFVSESNKPDGYSGSSGTVTVTPFIARALRIKSPLFCVIVSVLLPSCISFSASESLELS